MPDWIKLKKLSPAEARTILLALLLLPIINILLKVLGFKRMIQLIERITPIKTEASFNSEAQAQATAIARLVAIAANHGLYRATCLRRSLLVVYWMRARDMAGTIRFGARLINGVLEAHAWVEWKQLIVNDAPDVYERFPPLESGLPTTQAGL